MNLLRKRIERIERTHTPSGRQIVVRANSAEEADTGMAAAGVVIGPTDRVLRIRRVVVDPHPFRRCSQLIGQFFLSIDGQPVPLIQEAL